MLLRFWFAGLMMMLSTAATFAATTPLEAVKSTAGTVLSALRDPQLNANRSQRRERIESALRARFDFDEMAKRSLGPNWAKQSEADRKQFVKQFTELLISTYTEVIDTNSVNVSKAVSLIQADCGNGTVLIMALGEKTDPNGTRFAQNRAQKQIVT